MRPWKRSRAIGVPKFTNYESLPNNWYIP